MCWRGKNSLVVGFHSPTGTSHPTLAISATWVSFLPNLGNPVGEACQDNFPSHKYTLLIYIPSLTNIYIYTPISIYPLGVNFRPFFFFFFFWPRVSFRFGGGV